MQSSELARRRIVQSRNVDAADACQPSPSVKVASGGQTVPTVVAGAADHRGSAVTETGHLPARGFHEPVDGNAETTARESVGRPDLAAIECRKLVGAGRQMSSKSRGGGWSRSVRQRSRGAGTSGAG